MKLAALALLFFFALSALATRDRTRPSLAPTPHGA
jgi:hypothetical protein